METETTSDNPYEHARTCTTLALFITVLLLVFGGIASNIGHARFDDLGVDWTGFGLWAGAAGVVLAVGQAGSAICKQIVDSLTP